MLERINRKLSCRICSLTERGARTPCAAIQHWDSVCHLWRALPGGMEYLLRLLLNLHCLSILQTSSQPHESDSSHLLGAAAVPRKSAFQYLCIRKSMPSHQKKKIIRIIVKQTRSCFLSHLQLIYGWMGIFTGIEFRPFCHRDQWAFYLLMTWSYFMNQD